MNKYTVAENLSRVFGNYFCIYFLPYYFINIFIYRLPQKLLVVFSRKIRNKIDKIYAKNQSNITALYQWFNYIDGIESYISNPTIAWDNMGRYPNYNNERRFINDFDYNIGYVIKINSRTNLPYVYVFKINLNPRQFGLQENKKANISRIIAETINSYLRKNLLLAN